MRKPKRSTLAINVLFLLSLGLISLLFMFRSHVAVFLFRTFSCAYPLHLVGAPTAEDAFALGNYYFSSSNYDLDKARIHFNAAIAMNGKLQGAHYQRGRLRFIVGNFDGAMRDIEYEEEINPELGKVFYMKGLIAGYQKDFEKAEHAFKKFITYDSFNWAGYNDLSWVYFAQGNYHYAEATAREGLVQAPGNPWLLNAVGVALLAEHRGAEALPFFTSALEGFKRLTPEQWGVAYPGNAPEVHTRGLFESIRAIERNIERVHQQAAQ